MTEAQLRKRVPSGRVEDALEEHLYKTICELFGKDDGYCKGRGGSMHIADVNKCNNLGSTGIVGGNQPTALGVSDDGKTLVFSDFLDNRLRVYRVPSHAELAKGGGGRAKSHLKDLPKRTAEK